MPLITFEGADAVGKSTQIRMLEDHLCARGLRPVTVREPGGTALAEAVRGLLMDPGIRGCPMADLFLFNAARAQLMHEIICPALDAGRVVLCDRFIDSTIAYQAHGAGLDRRAVEQVCLLASAGRLPDLTLLLEIPEHERAARMSARADNDPRDALALDMQARIRTGYRTIAAAHPERVITIDAARSPERIHRAVVEALMPVLEKSR